MWLLCSHFINHFAAAAAAADNNNNNNNNNLMHGAHSILRS
jgi:hypothetical protein